MGWPRLSLPVHASPYPPQIGMCILGVITSLVFLLKTGMSCLFLVVSSMVFLCVYMWWAELLEELESGESSLQVCDNLKLSFSLFILSEAMFFVTFFWTFLHYSFCPSVFVGHVWPSAGVFPINPKGVPFLNTFLLVSSGVTVTWGHHLLLIGDKKVSYRVFMYTVLLGVWFLVNQVIEFKEGTFSMGESVYGSVFLALTGFHGFHVLLGLFMLVEAADGLWNNSCSSFSHTKLEMFIWYWHFVDCIWLVVYSLIYWWGS